MGEIYNESQLTDMMHKAGVRPSVQRIAVLSYISNFRKHPSADEIYDHLVRELPTLSLTTVYNSLHALVDAGIVKELEIESGNKHYDLAYQPLHGHFTCRNCGKIFDIAMPEALGDAAAPGFKVDSVDVYYKGMCPDCLKLQK